MLKIVIIMTGLLMPLPAIADSGYSEVYTGLLSSDSEHPTIRMIKENVDATLKADEAAVEAVFYFTNQGPATEVDIVFPLAYWGGSTLYDPDSSEVYPDFLREEYGIDPSTRRSESVYKSGSELPERYDWLTHYIESFSVTDSGEKINTEIVEINELSDDFTIYDGKLFVRWAVSFDNNEERKVICTYQTPYSFFKNDYSPAFFEYALFTGASWADDIGNGTITITNETGNALWFDFTDYEAIPAAAVDSIGGNDVIKLTFSDYEPETDRWGGTILRVFLAQGLKGHILKTSYEDLGLPLGEGIPGRTLISMNFRTEPSSESPRVASNPVLKENTPFEIISGKGEWWKVKLADGTVGWLRWRYVDDGVEKHYARFYWVTGA